MKVYGHRGACGYAPENTIRSMKRALELNVDGIEFDVRLTKDHIPVVIHDATIDRTSDNTGPVNQFLAAELQAMSDPSVGIPTLDTVLKPIGRHPINVELKEVACVQPVRDTLLSAVSQQTIRPADVLISSFEHAALVDYRRISQGDEAQFSVAMLSKGIPDDDFWMLATQLDAMSVNIDVGSVDREFVSRAHQLGKQVMVYTVNTAEEADRMRQLDVDAIFSDFPDRVRS